MQQEHKMRKTDFIQHVIIRSLPKLNKVAAGIAYAEQLWHEMSLLGYGAAKQAQPRDNVNYYQALKPFQKIGFDKFWKAFNYKHDRNGAAMRWSQLGELEKEEYVIIIAAANKEATRTLPFGQTRKMAQGWLADMRYQDYQTTSADNPNNQLQQRYNALTSDLEGIKRLYTYQQTSELSEQIIKIEQQLEDIANEISKT